MTTTLTLTKPILTRKDITKIYKNEEYHFMMLLYEHFIIRMQERIGGDFRNDMTYQKYVGGYRAFELFLYHNHEVTEFIFEEFNPALIYDFRLFLSRHHYQMFSSVSSNDCAQAVDRIVQIALAYGLIGQPINEN